MSDWIPTHTLQYSCPVHFLSLSQTDWDLIMSKQCTNKQKFQDVKMSTLIPLVWAVPGDFTKPFGTSTCKGLNEWRVTLKPGNQFHNTKLWLRHLTSFALSSVIIIRVPSQIKAVSSRNASAAEGSPKKMIVWYQWAMAMEELSCMYFLPPGTLIERFA